MRRSFNFGYRSAAHFIEVWCGPIHKAFASLPEDKAPRDVVLCAPGLMCTADPERASRETRRVLRPGGRAGLAVWGARESCGWAPAPEIIDAEVASDVCLLFFRLGATKSGLADACVDAGFTSVELKQIEMTLVYKDDNAACEAVFAGGPVALAWSRFDATVRARVRERYLEVIAPCRDGIEYRLPASYIIATAS